MISPEKQTANQANAQHSTGPKTPEGKAKSAANSRTHGFCSKDNLVAAEDQEEFDQMAHGYQIDLAPEGAIEQTLADEIVAAAWQLRRMRRMRLRTQAWQPQPAPDRIPALRSSTMTFCRRSSIAWLVTKPASSAPPIVASGSSKSSRTNV